jgi:hypothetical protein
MTTSTAAPLAVTLAGSAQARLTRPLLDGWHIVLPIDVLVSACDTCWARVTFIRVRANDCDVWGMRGVDGAHSDAYGIYCAAHSEL